MYVMCISNLQIHVGLGLYLTCNFYINIGLNNDLTDLGLHETIMWVICKHKDSYLQQLSTLLPPPLWPCSFRPTSWHHSCHRISFAAHFYRPTYCTQIFMRPNRVVLSTSLVKPKPLGINRRPVGLYVANDRKVSYYFNRQPQCRGII